MEDRYSDQMLRTTVYLPRVLVDRARVAASSRGVTAAAVIRAALDSALGDHRPSPTGGFLAGGGRARP